ncbi:4-phosphoerythronate dehydrogenase [Thiomicrorhabdus arctica]|uniref:4-phosphoerythronate dehydrogenase n=1 Tax=Thiomicrorhabdus arctica TaxID=131540 RepID=UPI00036D4B2F|nr:4-phosphoerythronate dehydrogenase [Thiomicrorhabdus arctica]
MTNQKTIIIDDAIPYAKAIFSHLGEVVTLPGKNIDAASIKHADALIVRSRTQVNAELLKGSSVQFVGSTVVGLDHIDQTYLKEKGITFYSAQGCNANSVAEFVISALFDLAETKEFDLTQKTLGIIGVGHVGHLVHEKATALGITCLLNDPPRQRQQTLENSQESFVDLETCLKADIITFHTPLTVSGQDATLDLLSAERLEKILPHQILINAARGGIINESAWCKTPTLANVIDCWENEPTISESLYKTAYLATPHIAGHSLEAKVAGSEMVYQALCNFWKTPQQLAWKKELPSALPELVISEPGPTQTILNSLFKKTHNSHQDDAAIRADSITEIHNKYEFYRRNFPIYREWHCHSVHVSNNENVYKLIRTLGFSLNT